MAARPQVAEFHRLQTVAAQSRLEVMGSQIALGFTFCRVAETQFGYGYVGQAGKLMEKVRKLAETVRRHLSEPGHVPLDRIEKVQTELAQLESTIVALEKRTT